jgi:hypothetical protein
MTSIEYPHEIPKSTDFFEVLGISIIFAANMQHEYIICRGEATVNR